MLAYLSGQRKANRRALSLDGLIFGNCWPYLICDYISIDHINTIQLYTFELQAQYIKCVCAGGRQALVGTPMCVWGGGRQALVGTPMSVCGGRGRQALVGTPMCVCVCGGGRQALVGTPMCVCVWGGG